MKIEARYIQTGQYIKNIGEVSGRYSFGVHVVILTPTGYITFHESDKVKITKKSFILNHE